jgi:hypothetical protein
MGSNQLAVIASRAKSLVPMWIIQNDAVLARLPKGPSPKSVQKKASSRSLFHRTKTSTNSMCALLRLSSGLGDPSVLQGVRPLHRAAEVETSPQNRRQRERHSRQDRRGVESVRLVPSTVHHPKTRQNGDENDRQEWVYNPKRPLVRTMRTADIIHSNTIILPPMPDLRVQLRRTLSA